MHRDSRGRNGWKRHLNYILAAAMIVGSMPQQVYAADAEAQVSASEGFTEAPTEAPAEAPAEAPTEVPTEVPTEAPTEAATEIQTESTEVPTEKETETETDKQTEKETEKETDKQTEKETEKETGKQTEKETEKETGKQTEKDTEKESEKNSEKQTEKDSEKNTEDGKETEYESESETELESESESETESESESESETEKDKKDKDKKKEKENIKPKHEGDKSEDHSDKAPAPAVNVIAGTGIYVGELQSTYALDFSADFKDVMDRVEAYYRQYLDKPQEFTARNWQDVLALYVVEYRQQNPDGIITMNADSEKLLKKCFFMMNPKNTSTMAEVLRQSVPGIDADQEVYSISAEDYIKLFGLDGDPSAVLKNVRSVVQSGRNMTAEEAQAAAQRNSETAVMLRKYASVDCGVLCAIVSQAPGIIRETLGDNISQERAAIVTAAYSLIGKVGYFWGGKSYAKGWDPLWGSPMMVSASGSQSSGTLRGYGLDCSGYVLWAFFNGIDGDAGIGGHTTTQWNASAMVDQANARPGDLVFYNAPDGTDNNHVGIVIGKKSDGSLLVAHCSSSQNGVVVGEAWSSGFRYVRTPVALP